MRRWLAFLCLFLLACQALPAISIAALGAHPETPLRTHPGGTAQDTSPVPALGTWPDLKGGLTPTPASDPEGLQGSLETPTPTLPDPKGFQKPLGSEEPIQGDPAGFTVRFHPDGPLYVGDLVSLEVIAPAAFASRGYQVQVEGLAGGTPRAIGKADFEAFGIGRRPQATLTWAWDTAGLTPGDHELRFAVRPKPDCPDGEECPPAATPGSPSWTLTLRLLPEVEVPPPEPQAHWETVETACCILHFITGTDAARDIVTIQKIADEEAAAAASQMGVGFSEPLRITLLPRVLGHGGFTGEEIYVSYLDRNYAGNDLAQVLHHEMIHVLDGRLGGELRPSILVEGLAVYLSGGHFKKEALFPRAAALLELSPTSYLPLEQLADTFYMSQHEIGYLEGAALVTYLVDGYGWEAFEAFYRDIHPHPSGKQSRAMDAALQAHFDLTFTQLEQRFKAELYRQPHDPAAYKDLRLSVAFYESVRRYQQILDPSAYFLTAWLPDGSEMRERGIVADYLRRPEAYENIAVEELLVQADLDLRSKNYPQVEEALMRIARRLDRIELPLPLEGLFILLLTLRRPKRLPRRQHYSPKNLRRPSTQP